MKNIIINAERSIEMFAKQSIIEMAEDRNVTEYLADDLIQLGKDIKALCSDDNVVALSTFKRLFRMGHTTHLLNADAFEELEQAMHGDVQIVIFKKNGIPLGIVGKQDIDF